jgi:hypothetical protein
VISCVPVIPRRRFVACAVAMLTLQAAARADDPVIDIGWSDLVPDTDGISQETLRGLGLTTHDEMSAPADQPPSNGVTMAYDQKTVRLSGFVVPIGYSGIGVSAFILVPYVGACIHVPPPPSNQLVFVTTATPFKSEGLFAPVTVTGMFGTSSTSTQLAEIGYALSADRIEPYEN